MAQKNKTTPTGASVDEYIASRANDQQAADCRALTAILKRVTKKDPHMWGPSIVGFGSYKYTYDSGHSGEAPVAGYAIRGRELVVYLMVESEEQQALLANVGKYKLGKSCFYFKRLADLDVTVFEKLVASSVAAVRKRWPDSTS